MSIQRSPALSDSLKLWADRNLFHMEKGGYLSNHMSHGLIALGNLGASEERLNNFGAIYRSQRVYGHKLEQAQDYDKSTIESLEQLLELRGKYKNFLGIAEYFKQEVDSGSITAKGLVQKYLPYVVEGMSGRLLHPMITLGYALNAEDDDLIIDGLTYMVYGYLTTGAHPKIDLDNMKSESQSDSDFKPEDIVRLIEKVKNENRFKAVADEWESKLPYSLEPAAIQRRTAALAERTTDFIDQYMEPLLKNKFLISAFIQDRDQGTTNYKEVISRIFDGLLWVYNDTSEFYGWSNFVLLHGVTSCWSLAQILPVLTPELQLEAVLHYLRAMIVSYASMYEHDDFIVGKSPYERDFTSQYAEIPGFSSPVKHIMETNESDEHKIKVVCVCIDRIGSTNFVPVTSETYINTLKVIAARQFDQLSWEKPN